MSNKDVEKIKVSWTACLRKRMEGAQKDERKKIKEMGDSFRGLYIRNIANIMPNRSYLRSNAIPKLYAIGRNKT